MRGMDVLNFANWFVRELWPPRGSLPGITIAEVAEIIRGLGKTEIFFFQKCLFTGMGWRLDEYWCGCGSFGSAERTRLDQLCISNPHARHTTLLASRPRREKQPPITTSTITLVLTHLNQISKILRRSYLSLQVHKRQYCSFQTKIAVGQLKMYEIFKTFRKSK